MSLPEINLSDEIVTNPVSPKGRVLFIGASYYNNWYLSRELRKLGWKADMIVHASEGAKPFLHGCDHYLESTEFLPANFTQRIFNVLVDAYLSDMPNPSKWPISLSTLKKIYSACKMLESFDERNFIAKILNRGVAYLFGPIERCFQDFALRVKHDPNPQNLSDLLELIILLLRDKKASVAPGLSNAISEYDIIHYTGVNSIRYLYLLNSMMIPSMPIGWDVDILKKNGMIICHTNTGCLDGVTPSSFSKWLPEPVCKICIWRNRPDVCSDELSHAWGKLRNKLCDYQVTFGGNRVDYNDDSRVHEVPQFYCLDPEIWKPDLDIPEKWRVPGLDGKVVLFHGVGNVQLRTDITGKNIKCSHIYLPLIERLKKEGYPIELLHKAEIPNFEYRFIQAQADIFLDMLTFGWFGALGREAMMLGKVYVCYLRPEWLEQVREQQPEYVRELPVVSATPETIYSVLTDLINNPAKRAEIGRRSRAFAVKYHSRQAAGKTFDEIYSTLLNL